MDPAPNPIGPTDCVALTTAKGLAIRVELAVETVVSLRHQIPAALRIEPTIVQEDGDEKIPARVCSRLCEEDLARIDQATFDFADRLLAESRNKPAIIIPVSFFTVAARKGRVALAKVGGGSAVTLKASIMVEFVDVDRGTPISRLTEVGGLIGGVCRAVLVRVQPGLDMLGAVRGYRPHGLTLDRADLAEVDAQIATQILSFGDQAEGAAPLLIVQGLASDGFFEVAEVAGLTHASLRAPPPAAAKPQSQQSAA